MDDLSFGPALNLNASLLANFFITLSRTSIRFHGNGRGTAASPAIVVTACFFSSPICDFEMPATNER